MAKQTDKKAPLSSPLHFFAGIYLLYTAWNLRTAVADRPLFLIAVIVFGIAGAGIIALAAWGMYKNRNAVPEAPKDEESEEKTDE